MTDIAVWTDGKERVRRKHHNPSDVDTSGTVSVTSEDPSPPTTEDYETVEEYFNETDGFYYEVSGEDLKNSLSEEQRAILTMAEEMEYERLDELKNAYGVDY